MSDTLSGDRRPLLVNASAAMMVLAFIAVLLRFVCRRWTRAPLLMDDWLILAALVGPISYARCARLLILLLAVCMDTSHRGDLEYEVRKLKGDQEYFQLTFPVAKKYHYGLHTSQLAPGDAQGFFRGLYVYEVSRLGEQNGSKFQVSH